MAKVTFACVCVESHVSARVERDAYPADCFDLLFEESGKQALDLAAGKYELAYRAQGTPGSLLTLSVTGGAMAPIDRTVPSDGRLAGVRTLIVRALLLPLALLAARPSLARAQELAGAADARGRAEHALATLPNISDVLTTGYYLALEASADSKTGTGAIAIDNRSGAFSASFSLEAPLTESTKQARPITLNGLTNSGSGTIALHWFRWPNHPDVTGMRRLCQQALGKTDCDDDELPTAKDRRAFLRLSHAGDAPTIVNVEATLGRQAFSYAESGTLERASVARTELAASIGAGHYAPSLGYAAVAYRFSREYDAGDGLQLCMLSGAGTVLTCRDTVVGGPTERLRHSAVVEWRRFLPGGSIAIDPSFAYDFRGHASSIDVPFYFLALSAGGLAGGARAAWRSDEKGVAVAIFIGAALHLTQ